ncbi:unnamed protein product [Fraxinus pennsylvanica]|uniref:Uncharacterized protein n=1 Tax=Fraxinus pennsylvanica TaxID=56036 RepID=A0AAD1ZDS6_9LAMI|nr:unnamed protein product [Fraxinus pennsylvanica]
MVLSRYEFILGLNLKIMVGVLDSILQNAAYGAEFIGGSVQVMGVKRLFDEEDFQELSFKQAKRLGFEDKLAPFSENFPHYETSPEVDLRGDGSNFCKLQVDEALENDDIGAAFNVAGKDLDTSVPLSWVTSSSDNDSAGFEDISRWSHFPENFDFLDPSRGPYQFKDGYSSLFNYVPTKKVHIGLTHQANLPIWDPYVTRKDHTGFNCLVEIEEKLMGTCIIPMPDLNTSTYNDVDVGRGRTDCGCLDKGSMRCVQQHVNEAREKLRETFWDENFMELGFYEMGEEVAHKWTEEDELSFHKVIYCNPVSLGKRFWKLLAVVFPTRTKKEIVCYYFNAFILRRRSVQNRSKLLEIDSDDDEWQGTDGGFCRLEREEEESVVESFDDQDDSSSQNDDNDDDDYNDGGNDDVGNLYAIEMDDGTSQKSRLESAKLHDGLRLDYKPHHLDGIQSKIEGDQDVEEHISTFSKTQSQMTDIMGSVGLGSVGQVSRHKNDHRKYSNEITLEAESNDDFGFGFVIESCDANIWDDTYSTGLMKSVDLLPTSNMIEEIFGSYDAWNMVNLVSCEYELGLVGLHSPPHCTPQRCVGNSLPMVTPPSPRPPFLDSTPSTPPRERDRVWG